jgi:hypothetical protein
MVVVSVVAVVVVARRDTTDTTISHIKMDNFEN